MRPGSPEGDVKALRIRELVEHFGVSPDHAAYVGDFPGDVKAARTAGVKALAAGWCPSTNVEWLVEARPDGLFRTPAELVRWVEPWLASARGDRP